MSETPRRRPVRASVSFLFENSLFLVGGAIGALVWANLDAAGYHSFITHPLTGDASGAGGHEHAFDLKFLVNDVLMALFFAIAAKEIWEALLPGGALSDPRKAATPFFATLGGMAGPAIIYASAVTLWGPERLEPGWAIPMATDIAFSYFFARFIFGPGHVAIPFLLLLAILDDAGGLIVLAIFYPKAPVEPAWLLLSVGAIAVGFLMRRLRLQSFWWYLLIPGTLSWYSFFSANLHPALGLVPIVPTLPHAHTDLGVFAREELGRKDTLSEFEHWWKNPVELVLGVFGLVNAGVVMSSFGNGTFYVLAGLVIGKPLGVTLFTVLARAIGLRLPEGMNFRDVIVVGIVAGLGFTVALFVSDAAFGGIDSKSLDSTKMGALLSFGAGFVGLIVARILKVGRRIQEVPSEEPVVSQSA